MNTGALDTVLRRLIGKSRTSTNNEELLELEEQIQQITKLIIDTHLHYLEGINNENV